MRARFPLPATLLAVAAAGAFHAPAGEFPIGGPPMFPTLVFGPSDVMTCPGGAVQFQTKATPPNAGVTLEYQWQFETAPQVWVDLVGDPNPTPQSRYVIYTDTENQASTLLINHLGPLDSGRYRCHVTASNGVALLAPTARATALIFDIGSPGGVFGPDGVQDNNDMIVFMDGFFSGAAWADVGSAGGVKGGDGRLDNNDFVAYIDLFFDLCLMFHNPPLPPGEPLLPWPIEER